MKKAIIIPVYLQFNQPEEIPFSEGLKLVKRAVESLKILKDQNFTLILSFCFDAMGRKEEISLLHLQNLRESLVLKNFGNITSLIDLKGYPRIRNTGLLLAQSLSMGVWLS